MGRGLFIFCLIFSSQGAFGQTLAEKTCSELRQQVLDACENFTFNQMTYFDRISFDLAPETKKIDELDMYSFNGDRCIRTKDFNQLYMTS